MISLSMSLSTSIILCDVQVIQPASLVITFTRSTQISYYCSCGHIKLTTTVVHVAIPLWAIMLGIFCTHVDNDKDLTSS